MGTRVTKKTLMEVNRELYRQKEELKEKISLLEKLPVIDNKLVNTLFSSIDSIVSSLAHTNDAMVRLIERNK